MTDNSKEQDALISKKQFVFYYRSLKGGKILKRSEKSSLWDELSHIKGQNILVKGPRHYALPKENMPLFKQWLFKKKGVIVLDDLRDKLETDITRVQFSECWRFEKAGNLMPAAICDELWEEAKNSGENLLILVKSGKQTTYVLPQENISAFKLWLYKEKDVFAIQDKGILTDRAKNESDITRAQFLGWRLQQDKKFIGDQWEKGNLWDELATTKEQNILVKTRSNPPSYVLPKENIPVFKQWLFKEKNIVVANDLRDKLETDITKVQFTTIWHVEKNGKFLSVQEMNALWDNLIKNEENILLPAKAGNLTIYVLPKENIPTLTQWIFKEKHAVLIDKSTLVTKERCESDIFKADFAQNWVLKKGGEVLKRSNKVAVWEELSKIKEQNILVRVKVATRTPFVLPEENVADFKQWLKEEKGIIATDPLDKVIKLREQASLAKTPAERNKYLTQAEKLYKKLYPDYKIENICSPCLAYTDNEK